MPIQNYSVLKGDPVNGKLVFGKSPHYQIEVDLGNNQTATIAVNVQSLDHSEVRYVINQDFTPPAPDQLLALPVGFTKLASQPGGLALDFIRSQVNGAPMVTEASMSLLPESQRAGTRENELNNAVVSLLNSAIQDANGTIYAFGSSYADPGEVQGIHDIHMNQGNPPDNHETDNGVWQDGALLINLPATNNWTAIFIAFQTESWNTDNTTGDPIA